MAARQGLEPQFLGPKPSVLPLDDRAMSFCYTTKTILQHTTQQQPTQAEDAEGTSSLFL